MAKDCVTDDIPLLSVISVPDISLKFTRHPSHIQIYLKIDIFQSDKDFIGPISHTLTCIEPARSLGAEVPKDMGS